MTRALNGLGYAAFFGRGLEQNYTEALHYFERAAAPVGAGDADSAFNAGYMHEHGLGTPAVRGCAELRCIEPRRAVVLRCVTEHLRAGRTPRARGNGTWLVGGKGTLAACLLSAAWLHAARAGRSAGRRHTACCV